MVYIVFKEIKSADLGKF